MTLEQRLISHYQKDAKIADMGGYGLSGGDMSHNVLDQYQTQLMNTLNTSIPRSGMEGSGLRKRGRPKGKGKKAKAKGGFFPGAAFLIPAAISLISNLAKTSRGSGLSGGIMSGGVPSGGIMSGGMINPFTKPVADGIMKERKGSPSIGYPSKYPGSFPMPGFYPGIQSGDMTHMGMGDGLSGGTSHKQKHRKSPSRVSAGKKAASENPWLKKVAAYRKKHSVSQRDAMIALKGTC